MDASDIVNRLLENDDDAESTFVSSDPNVPPSYRIDTEFNCLSNAENLAKANRKLRYVEGWCRFPGKRWGSHAWCETREGIVVDPYFEWRFGEKQKQLQYKKAEPGENVFENDDEVDPKEFAMAKLYDQPGHTGDVIRRDGSTLSRSRNMAGIRRLVGKCCIDYVNIWPLSDEAHPAGGLEIRFSPGGWADGSSYRTRFESYDVLKWSLRTWRNLYGARLQVKGEDAGKVSYSNPVLR